MRNFNFYINHAIYSLEMVRIPLKICCNIRMVKHNKNSTVRLIYLIHSNMSCIYQIELYQHLFHFYDEKTTWGNNIGSLVERNGYSQVKNKWITVTFYKRHLTTKTSAHHGYIMRECQRILPLKMKNNCKSSFICPVTSMPSVATPTQIYAWENH